MSIEHIKAMYNFTKEIEENRKALYQQAIDKEEELTQKAIDKIYSFFNAILDSMYDDHISFHFKDSKEPLTLHKRDGVQYALFPFNYRQILVCSNYTGYIDLNTCRHKAIDEVYPTIAKYCYKEQVIDYFLQNREEIEQAIYQEITKRIDRKIKNTTKQIKNKADYLERLNQYVGKEEEQI